ncbi:hypothetical protein N7471_009111 [Penicillium samsonianum]|uniref:uncharacterized protein n=1 Tax=Penicillium samsonianum TaxID=1882272 RepID=UPI002549AAD5|nr:uncharacterized protein N7471_009111 [Penicillium samsonianum]KAJ6127894.1 hypothetical protein N7471_009111 [Penicillium samsonianum]
MAPPHRANPFLGLASAWHHLWTSVHRYRLIVTRAILGTPKDALATFHSVCNMTDIKRRDLAAHS